MANKPGKMEKVVNLQQLQGYYDGKKVFLTGHTGFKGAWLNAILHLAGAHVKGYALAPEHDYDLFHRLGPVAGGESVIADIRDKGRLLQEIRSFKPDYIFHLAAQPLVRRSYAIPAETFDVNVVGTANLLEAVHSLDGPCSVVVITTDKVYENKEKDILYREDDILGGYDPYSASKACAELVVQSFRNSFFNIARFDKHHKAIAAARAGNVIGGGDWSEDRIIPDIIRSLQQQQPVEVRNPHAVRPWQHVLEPLSGYLLLGGLLAKKPQAFSTAYNFGPYPGDHLTVKELVELAVHEWGSGNWKDISGGVQPHEAGLLKLDIGRAITQLGWKPRLDAKAAIEWTLQWYKKPAEEQAGFTLQQIKKFLAA